MATLVLAFVLFDELVIQRHLAPVVVSGSTAIAKVTGVRCLGNGRGGPGATDYVTGTVEATKKLRYGMVVNAAQLTTGGKQVGFGQATFWHPQPGQRESFAITISGVSSEPYDGCFVTWLANGGP